ncbi:MAG: hypothetical protein IH994_06830 [Proteobacteria bacterium]|nr:hypothetical protein [Pseudomonadota bacterium]
MIGAIEIIHRDHVNLDRVLNVLETVVDGLAPDQPKPDLEPLYSAVYYIRVFPDRRHQLRVRHGQRSAVRREHGNRVSGAFRENHPLI